MAVACAAPDKFLKAITVAISKSLLQITGPGTNPPAWVQTLRDVPELDFAVLVGSRALDTARPDSDWDTALQWSPFLAT